MRRIIFTALFLILILRLFSQADCVLVTVNSIRSTDGVIRYALYNEKNVFNSHTDIFKEGIVEVNGSTVRFLIKGVPDGTYAISLLHDENNDGDLNMSVIGMPKEGFGFSNDVKVTLGPPKFEGAKFIKKGETAIRVKMRYML